MAYSSLRTSESTQKFGFSSKLKHGHLSLSGNNLTVTKTTSNRKYCRKISTKNSNFEQFSRNIITICNIVQNKSQCKRKYLNRSMQLKKCYLKIVYKLLWSFNWNIFIGPKFR